MLCNDPNPQELTTNSNALLPPKLSIIRVVCTTPTGLNMQINVSALACYLLLNIRWSAATSSIWNSQKRWYYACARQRITRHVTSRWRRLAHLRRENPLSEVSQFTQLMKLRPAVRFAAASRSLFQETSTGVDCAAWNGGYSGWLLSELAGYSTDDSSIVTRQLSVTCPPRR